MPSVSMHMCSVQPPVGYQPDQHLPSAWQRQQRRQERRCGLTPALLPRLGVRALTSSGSGGAVRSSLNREDRCCCCCGGGCGFWCCRLDCCYCCCCHRHYVAFLLVFIQQRMVPHAHNPRLLPPKSIWHPEHAAAGHPRQGGAWHLAAAAAAAGASCSICKARKVGARPLAAQPAGLWPA